MNWVSNVVCHLVVEKENTTKTLVLLGYVGYRGMVVVMTMITATPVPITARESGILAWIDGLPHG